MSSKEHIQKVKLVPRADAPAQAELILQIQAWKQRSLERDPDSHTLIEAFDPTLCWKIDSVGHYVIANFLPHSDSPVCVMHLGDSFMPGLLLTLTEQEATRMQACDCGKDWLLPTAQQHYESRSKLALIYQMKDVDTPEGA